MLGFKPYLTTCCMCAPLFFLSCIACLQIYFLLSISPDLVLLILSFHLFFFKKKIEQLLIHAACVYWAEAKCKSLLLDGLKRRMNHEVASACLWLCCKQLGSAPGATALSTFISGHRAATFLTAHFFICESSMTRPRCAQTETTLPQTSTFKDPPCLRRWLYAFPDVMCLWYILPSSKKASCSCC